jgi:hypothetical protein
MMNLNHMRPTERAQILRMIQAPISCIKHPEVVAHISGQFAAIKTLARLSGRGTDVVAPGQEPDEIKGR